MTTQLLTPTLARLPALVAALRRGWSPDNVRGEVAAREMLERIDADAALFIERQTDPQALGEPLTLPDGTQVRRLPGRTFWIWSDEEPDHGFCGSLGFRWQPGTAALPPHVPGHVGYAVVPWQRGRGHATAALRAVLPHAQELGLPWIELTTDPDNVASQKVIERAGGRLLERFVKPAAFGGHEGLRYRIPVPPSAP